ncbi:MAG: MBL fold metallo-hydrolase [Syntrophomonadaceae bacterium]|nr:MBL fold metallo-hydrolase [Syntrophomonadaceae bacterium]
MKLKFLGAAKTVTGSFFVVETEKHRLAVDCGLFQGPKDIQARNYNDFPIDPQSIDFVVITHAHIDHIGLVPKLCKNGFKGNIYCSHATESLAAIMLPDSGHIQESEVERKNRKLKRAGLPLLKPIYTTEDALECLPRFRSLNIDEIIALSPEISVMLRDAGHILGACIVEIWIEEEGKKQKLVFSGDLGNNDQPIIKDPSIIENADYVIMESTYGDRFHEDPGNRSDELAKVIEDTMRKGGNLIIPAFAVERTQDLLYDLIRLLKQGKLDPGIDIYIDSPLAIAATEIFMKHTELFDDETRTFIECCPDPFKIINLKFSRTQEQSVQLNMVKRNTIIISASGMCEAGRIKHHLKHNLWRPESTILFVGYQAEGTLGRRILNGDKCVKIHGEKVAVKADIRQIEAYSAHADRKALLKWIENFAVPPQGIFLVHGEESSQLSLADAIEEQFHIPVDIPDWLEEVELKPSLRFQAKGHAAVEQPGTEKINKALEAQELYLQTSQRIHQMFNDNWSKGNYDKIIEYLKKIDSN